MFVFIDRNTKNGCLGSAFIGFGLVFNTNGFYLSDIEDFISNPALSYSGYYSGLKRGTRTSDVTALFTTNRTIFVFDIVSSSIFLHITCGTSILKLNFILCYFVSYVTISYPRIYVV